MVDTTQSLSDAHRAATDPILIHVGAKVREVRELNGLSPEQLAAKINEFADERALGVVTDAKRVLRLESGHYMSDNAFMFVPMALGISPEVLYEGLPTREAVPEAPLNQDAVDQLKRILQLLPPAERLRHFRAAEKLADIELTVQGRDHDGSVS